jgi:hypothetical protein
MAKNSIPDDVKAKVKAIVEKFNQKESRYPDTHFFAVRFRGAYAYLDRHEEHIVSKNGRVTWTGKMKEWDFAIYKYSSESYDPDEWMFPGSEHLNGTVEGALRACLEAY